MASDLEAARGFFWLAWLAHCALEGVDWNDRSQWMARLFWLEATGLSPDAALEILIE